MDGWAASRCFLIPENSELDKRKAQTTRRGTVAAAALGFHAVRERKRRRRRRQGGGLSPVHSTSAIGQEVRTRRLAAPHFFLNMNPPRPPPQ